MLSAHQTFIQKDALRTYVVTSHWLFGIPEKTKKTNILPPCMCPILLNHQHSIIQSFLEPACLRQDFLLGPELIQGLSSMLGTWPMISPSLAQHMLLQHHSVQLGSLQTLPGVAWKPPRSLSDSGNPQHPKICEHCLLTLSYWTPCLVFNNCWEGLRRWWRLPPNKRKCS